MAEFSDTSVLVLGAGLAGLSAAYHLDTDYKIFESDSEIGGSANSFRSCGFTFDHAIHILFSRDPYAGGLIRKLLGDNFEERQRSSWIYSCGTYTPYPYQAHLFGLPQSVIDENIAGLVAAYANPGIPVSNFEDWIRSTFGEGIARNFMIPFNRKVWACEPRDMTFGWIHDRVMMPKLDDVLHGARHPAVLSYGSNAQFWYPRYGGTAALAQSFLPHISPVQTSTSCLLIDPNIRRASFSDGTTYRYKHLISTLPLPRLIAMLRTAPDSVREAAALLRSNRVLTINLGIDRPDISSKHWVYFAEERFPFHRISFPANFSKSLVPAGTSSIMIEISESDQFPIDRQTIVARTIASLTEIGILHEADRILTTALLDIDPAYIIYDHNHSSATALIHRYLETVGIESCGRFGEWEYLNMDQAILSGKRAADRIPKGRRASTTINHSSLVPQSLEPR